MSTEVQISFPGLGIETFTVNKVACEIFGFDVRWYGHGVCVCHVSLQARGIYQG